MSDAPVSALAAGETVPAIGETVPAIGETVPAIGETVRLPARPLNVGVVGATGNVGAAMLAVLAERNVPIASLRAFASSRSAGQMVRSGELSATVEDLDTADPSGLDVALFSAGAQRSLDHGPRFADAGCVVIDNSSAFRMDPGTALVVPEVNADEARRHQRIIANPNCSTIQLVVALKPIFDAAGLERVHVTTFQSVSGTGKAAMDELAQQTPQALSGEAVSPSIYPRQIAFNVLPHCDAFDEAGNTKEELKLVHETRKILGAEDLRVSATCVRVPVMVAHAEAVHIETTRPLSPEAARGLLAQAPGIRLMDDPAQGLYPTPLDAEGIDDVLVGRVRTDHSVTNGLAMFVVADNLRKGAATNAVQILESLVEA